MSQNVDSNFKTYTAGAAIGRFIRVKLSSGVLAVAVLADREWIGTLEEASFASGDIRRVRLRSSFGTMKMIANAAIAAGAPVFTVAAGKVGATGTGAFYVGVALEAAGADGDTIEVLHIGGETAQ